jgi:hypothetical protein
MRARITPKKRNTKPSARKKAGPAVPRASQSGSHRGEDIGRFGGSESRRPAFGGSVDEIKPRRGEAC